MVDEPENLALAQLREIRTTLAQHSGRFDRIESGFDRIDKRFVDMHLLVNHALGAGTANYVRVRELDARQQESEARQRRLDEQFADFERRLVKVEEKIGA